MINVGMMRTTRIRVGEGNNGDQFVFVYGFVFVFIFVLRVMTITSVRQGLWGEVMFLSVFAFLFVFVFWVGDNDQDVGGCVKWWSHFCSSICICILGW